MADNIPVEGNLDLKGNQIKNVAIEVVTSLPTTNRFEGRKVTYQGRSYIWNGSAWKCDSDYLEIGGRNLIIGSFNDWRSRLVGTYGYQLAFIPIQDDWRGKTVTHSFEVKDIPDGERVRIRIDLHRPDNTYTTPSYGNIVNLAGKTFVNYIVPTDTQYNRIGARIMPSNYTSSYNVLFRCEKLEFGNIPTDWTPAPEDVQAEIDRKVDKAGDTMSGNLNMGGNELKNAAIEVVTSLPTTNNFEGRQVTYQGKSYIWDDSAWKCDAKLFNLIKGTDIASLDGWSQSGWSGTISTYTNEPRTYKLVSLTGWRSSRYQLPLYLIGKKLIVSFKAMRISSETTATASRWISLGNGNSGTTYPDYITEYFNVEGYGDSSNLPDDTWVECTKSFILNDLARFRIVINGSPSTEKTTWLIKDLYLTEETQENWNISLEDKANENQTINFDISNIEPTQAGTVTKTSTWLWQYLVQSINFLWLKLVGLFSAGSATTNDNYLPKIDDVNKKLVKSNISDDGTTPKYGTNTIWHSGNDGLGFNKAYSRTIGPRLHNTNSKSELYIPFPSKAGAIVLDVEAIVDTYAVGTTYYIKKRFYLTQYNTAGQLHSQQSQVLHTLHSSYYYIDDFIDDTSNGRIILPIYASHNRNISIKLTAFGTDDIAKQILEATFIANVQTGVTPPAAQTAVFVGSVIGNAATATDSDKLDGKHASDFADADHDHGHIKDDGSIATDTNIATGDRILITDSDEGDKIKSTSISFNTDNRRFLREDGIWSDTPLPGVATDTTLGSIKIGYTPDTGSPGNLPVRLGINDNLNKAFVVITSRIIKQILGVNNSNVHNGDDIFISGMPTPSSNFNEILYIGSYRVYGTYSNAPKQNCGTSTVDTTNMKGSLNVFRSGANDWETIQQLFWVRNEKTEQYQRSYDGATWTVWKRLIKCDDYADMDGNGGIISSANLQELFRSPDIIQLWNDVEETESFGEGTYYLDLFSYIDVTIENILRLEGNEITGLNPERVYRVTYEVHFVRKEGEGEVTIRIENEDGVLYSVTDYIFDWQNNRSISFSVMLTNLDYIRPVIEISGGLTVFIPPYGFQINVEEIKYPFFSATPLTH